MDNEPVKQSTGAWQAWLFIVLLGPPLGAFLVFAPWYLFAVIKDGKSIMDITRGFPPAMAFVSIFSYVAGLPAAIVFASCSSYKIAKYKSLSWRVTSFIIPIAAIVAFAWSSYILEMQGAPFVVKASLLAGVAAILSALFCRLLLEALQIIRPLMESELPDWVKPMSYIFLSVWFIIVVVGAEKLSRTNIAWP